MEYGIFEYGYDEPVELKAGIKESQIWLESKNNHLRMYFKNLEYKGSTFCNRLFKLLLAKYKSPIEACNVMKNFFERCYDAEQSWYSGEDYQSFKVIEWED